MFELNPYNKPTAILEIVILLLIAFLIGILFTWLYWRGKYRALQSEHEGCTKRIKALEAELKAAKTGTAPESDEDEALARVASKKSHVDFGRIGHALADEKDDLKLIKGIGPFLEKKMNALGIVSFRQVANFNEADEDTINEIIEFFPGRIKRDQWVKQAREFVKNPPKGK